MIRLVVLSCLALALGLPLFAGCGDGLSDDPQATVEAFFAALAAGDKEVLDKLVLQDDNYKRWPKPGSEQYALLRAMGASFKSVEKVEINGDSGKAKVNLDSKAFMDTVLKESQKTLAGVSNPQMRQKMAEVLQASAQQLADRFKQVPVSLIRDDGRWKIHQFM